MNWEIKKFIDFIQLQRGYDLTKDQFIEGPYPVVSSTSIMGYHNQYKVEGPGVVIGRSGTLGKVQYIDNNYWPHNTSLYVKDYKGNYPRFVYYFLMNFATDKHGGGSAVPTLNRNSLSSINIKVPDINTQKRIADILSAYDDLIENNQKQIKLLEEAAMRLYKEWFVNLRFPGHEKTKIVKGVPEGWILTTVKSMGRVVTGKTPSTEIADNYGGDVPFVKIPDMYGVIYPIKTEVKLSKKGADTQKSKFLPPNSIMVSCIATVGLVCITHEICQTNQQINSIILNEEEYLYYMFFKMKGIKSLLEGIGSNGATMTNVNKAKFENIELLKPENGVLKKFNDLVEPFFKNIFILSKQNENFKQARDKLIPKLMSGEIEI